MEKVLTKRPKPRGYHLTVFGFFHFANGHAQWVVVKFTNEQELRMTNLFSILELRILMWGKHHHFF
jgi:hypothetical protein